jgi:hypothetical protein
MLSAVSLVEDRDRLATPASQLEGALGSTLLRLLS